MITYLILLKELEKDFSNYGNDFVVSLYLHAFQILTLSIYLFNNIVYNKHYIYTAQSLQTIFINRRKTFFKCLLCF